MPAQDVPQGRVTGEWTSGFGRSSRYRPYYGIGGDRGDEAAVHGLSGAGLCVDPAPFGWLVHRDRRARAASASQPAQSTRANRRAGFMIAGSKTSLASRAPVRLLRGCRDGRVQRTVRASCRSLAWHCREFRSRSPPRVRPSWPGHPHAGGENIHELIDLYREIGPSPRGWGKPSKCQQTLFHYGPSPRGWGKRGPGLERCRQGRAIPTRVGKTSRRPTCRTRLAGHPHAGGENPFFDGWPPLPPGPSPRGWGKPPRQGGRDRTGRAIPTRVGKTVRRRSGSAVRSGHPHAGGENAHDFTLVQDCGGPSPRGWGKLRPKRFGRQRVRAIPTRVGNTCSSRIVPRSSSGHPHAGGENCPGNRKHRCPSGPSPRGWGKRGIAFNDSGVLRAIPTRVGKTPDPGQQPGRLAGHPHAGGENS